MSRHQPTARVVLASMLAAIPPLALLALLVSTVITPRLEPAAMTAAAIGVAAWGAHAGVLASGRRGGVWTRGLRQLGRMTGVVAIAVGVRVVSLGPPASAIEPSTVVSAILLLLVLLAARTIGRIHRRQADPLTNAAAHRTADAALAAALVAGAVTVMAVTTLGWTVDAVEPPVQWYPLAWLLATVAALVAARPTMLRARTATAPTSGSGWLAALLPIAGVTVAVVALITLVLAAGAEQRLRDALPVLPALQLDVFDGVADAGAASSPRRPMSGGGIGWQVAALVVVAVLLLTLGPRARRRRRRRRPMGGPGLSLLMVLRSLLGSGRASRVVTDDMTALEDPPPGKRAARLDRAPPAWVERVRPRPREPTAAILYDYRLVQRRLPDARRRRPAETVLAHAAREDAEALGELADLVCAIRFAGRRPTAGDADRSRELARSLRRDG